MYESRPLKKKHSLCMVPNMCTYSLHEKKNTGFLGGLTMVNLEGSPFMNVEAMFFFPCNSHDYIPSRKINEDIWLVVTGTMEF